jgi:hypothetical protein
MDRLAAVGEISNRLVDLPEAFPKEAVLETSNFGEARGRGQSVCEWFDVAC